MTDTSKKVKHKVVQTVREALKNFDPELKKQMRQRYKDARPQAQMQPIVDGILLDRFVEKHKAVNGTVAMVKSFSEVPQAVEQFVNACQLPLEMVMSDTDLMHGIDWPQNWNIERRSARSSDAVSVTDAICAIAETGTIVVANSTQVSSTHMFLPDNHIVILSGGLIVRHLEDALSICEPLAQNRSRGIHMITGPSKTADVEQTIQYGAHGPRKLHAVIIRENEND